MFHFPWVSRERLVEAERRLDKAEAESARLLGLLLDVAIPSRKEVATARPIAIDEPFDDGIRPVKQDGEETTLRFGATPFDKIPGRFKQEHKGTPNSKFMARAH